MSICPEFTVYCGPMWSSKTSKMLMRLDRYKHQKKPVLLFKPTLDDRYSESNVVTHSGWKYPAMNVSKGQEILDIVNQISEIDVPRVIAVDELFMIDGAGDVLCWLYKEIGLNIVVSTLDISSSGQPFIETSKVLSWATHIEKCTAVCAICGEDASFTHKFTRDDREIIVGGEGLYEPRCFNHYGLTRKL